MGTLSVGVCMVNFGADFAATADNIQGVLVSMQCHYAKPALR